MFFFTWTVNFIILHMHRFLDKSIACFPKYFPFIVIFDSYFILGDLRHLPCCHALLDKDNQIEGWMTYPQWLLSNRTKAKTQLTSQNFLHNSLEPSCKVFLVFPLTPCHWEPTSNDLHKAIKQCILQRENWAWIVLEEETNSLRLTS